MANQTISCPHCGQKIPLDEALSNEIKNQLRAQFEADFKKREKELEERKKSLSDNYQKKLEEEKKKIWFLAQAKASEKVSIEMKDLQSQLEEKLKKLGEAERKELEFRKKTRELEEKEKKLELELERRLEEREKVVAEKTKEEVSEEYARKVKEKDHQMEQMKKTIEELKRRSEQGSMQVQGDSQEEDLKTILQSSFPTDVIEDVPTGIRGADIIQKVKTEYGQECGIILWESKNTKSWSADWIRKLKEDQGTAKADIAIMATRVLPDGLTNFGSRDGIWVSEYKYALGFAKVLRSNLIAIAKVKSSLVGTDEKMKHIYSYLSSSQFKNRIENIVMAFQGMQGDLEKEKRALQRLWAKREKEIDRVIDNTSGLYGDLQGLVGRSLPSVEALELPEPDGILDEDGNEEQ